MSNGGLPDTKFWRRFRGRFCGVLKWQDVESLWVDLKTSPENWYVFDPAGPAPSAPMQDSEFLHFLDEAEELINQRRDRSSCGSIYLDDPQNPQYIKIFDPTNMGSSCSCSTQPVMPRWIISRMAPDTLPPPSPLEKPGIVQRLLGRL